MSATQRTKTRAPRSSDVTRARAMWICAAACALGALGYTIVALGARAPSASLGALSRPHERAGLACDACHAKENPAASCTGCHDAASHASTRPGHAAARRDGTLACIDCHQAHGDGQTITIAQSGAWIRSGGGAEIRGDLPHGAPSAVVPLVPLSACARCHDLASRTDPIAACVPANATATRGASTCMDEHKRAGDARRFAAWSAANEIARATPWVSAKRDAPAPWGLLGASLASALVALAFTRRRRARSLAAAPIAPPAAKKLPLIDASTCLGCHACVDACPFEVLEVRKFVAVVARPDDCCGAMSCEQACPNGSLRVEGADQSPAKIVDDHLESIASPGVFLAGDLTGLPLIKNALRQGAAVVDRIAETLPKRERARGEDYDVVIVGAGPAGIAASLRAKERGLRYATLEQSTIAASIQAFPRQKLVYDQPLDVPVEGELWLRECTKEELLAQWTRVARRHALAIREGHRVIDVARDGDAFVVRAESGEGTVALRARRVIVATGKRGSPRTLDVAIDPRAESKVFYHLADARSLAGQRVLVVGLGDSAMEAAIALAQQPGTRVTLCHRGTDFTRGKARNVSETKALAARGKIDLRLSTELVAVSDSATLATCETRWDLPIDAVFVLVGGRPSSELLERAGVYEKPQIVSEADP